MNYEIEIVNIGGKEYGVDEIVPAKIGCRLIGIAERTLRDYGVKREIPIYKIGNRNLFLISDLLIFSDARRIDANEC